MAHRENIFQRYCTGKGVKLTFFTLIVVKANWFLSYVNIPAFECFSIDDTPNEVSIQSTTFLILVLLLITDRRFYFVPVIKGCRILKSILLLLQGEITELFW